MINKILLCFISILLLIIITELDVVIESLEETKTDIKICYNEN